MEREVAAVKILENLPVSALTVERLAQVYSNCQGMPIPLVFLADILFHITKMDLEELSCSGQELLAVLMDKKQEREEEEQEEGEGEEELQVSLEVKNEGEEEEDTLVLTVLDWLTVDADELLSRVSISRAIFVLEPFICVVQSLAHAYANPCVGVQRAGQESILTWCELRDTAAGFLKITRPKISDALPILKLLRRKPILNCRELSQVEGKQLARFDKKWDHLRHLYPVVDLLADPICVLVEPLPLGPPPPQVAASIVAINAATVNPMPSSVTPINMADIAGTFSTLFTVQSIQDARAFAMMLRCQLGDANGAGGGEPMVRIAIFSAPAATFRLY